MKTTPFRMVFIIRALMANILIVEDDIDTNEGVCKYLQKAVYNTVPAFDSDVRLCQEQQAT